MASDNKDLNIIIKALLDEEGSTAEINQQIKNISKKIDQLELKVNPNLKGIEQLQQQVNQIQNQIQSNAKRIKVFDEESVKKYGDQLFRSLDEAVNKYKEFGKVDIKKTIDPASKELTGFNLKLEKANGIVENLKFDLVKIADGQGTINAYGLSAVKQLDRTSSLEEKILKEKQKTIRAAEKLKIQEKERAEQLKYQIELFKQQAQINAENAKRKYEGVIDNKKLDDYLKRVNAITADTPNAKREIDRLKIGFKQIESEARKSSKQIDLARKSTISLGEAIRIASIKFPLWVGVSTAFYGTARALRNIVDNLIEVDSLMTEIRRVMDDGTNFNFILEESVELSNELGRSLQDVLKSVSEFGRQGFSENEVLYLSEVSSLLQNVSDLSAEESIDAIVSAMKNFNIEAQNAISIADKLNEVDNNFSVSTQQLATSIFKAASTAAAYNVTIEELIGHTTAIAEVTRETGNVVGNSLKTIYSRLTTLPESVRLLNEIGVSVKDSSGDMKSASEILSELAGKYNSLSDEMKQNLGVTIAGRRQLSRFYALMQNFDSSVNATTTAINSQGSAYRENEKYMESIQAKINQMKTAWMELSLTIGDVGLRDIIIQVTESLTMLARGFSELTETTDGWNIKLPIYAASIYGLIKALTVLRTAVTGVKLSLGWIGIGLVALEGLATAFMGVTKASNKSVDSLEKNAKELQGTALRIEELIDKYEELKPIADENVKAKQELRNVMTELQNIAPQLTAKFNEEGKELELNTESARQYAESLKLLSERQIEIARTKLEISLIDTKRDLDDANKKLKEFEGKFEESQKRISELQKEYSVKTVEDLHNAMMQALQETTDPTIRSKIIEDVTALGHAFEKIRDTKYLEQLEKVQKLNNELSGLENRKKAIDDLYNSQIKHNNELEREEENLFSLKKLQQDVSAYLEDYVNKSSDLASVYNELNDGQELSISQIQKLIKDNHELAKAIEVKNGIITLNKDVVKDLLDVEEDRFKNTLRMLDEELRVQKSTLNSKLGLYIKEIDAIHSVAEARQAALAVAEEEFKRVGYSLDYTAAQALSDNVSTLYEELDDINKQRESIRNLINTDFSTSLSRSDSKSTKEKSLEKQAKEIIDAQVRQINNENILIKQKSETLSKQIQLAREQENYNRAIELTNQLIDNQKNYIDSLILANQKLHEEAEKIRSANRHFDTSFWFDSQGEATIKYIEQFNNASKEQQEEMDKLFNQLQKLKKAYIENSIEIKNMEFSINDSNRSLENLYKEIEKQRETLVNELNEIADDVISIYKEVYEKQKELALKAIDEEIDALDEAHKRKMDQLNEELQQYEDIINAKLKLIDRESEEEDYQKRLSKLEKERQKILEQLNILQLDDSFESRAKQQELLEKLSEKEIEIEELKTDRERELRKQNLQDQLEEYRQDVEEKRKAEDEKYTDHKERLEKEKRDIERHYDNLINNERNFAKIREQIIEGSLQNTMSDFATFSDFVKQNMEIIGESISYNLIDKINEAKDSLSEFDYTPLGGGGSGNNQDESDRSSAWRRYLENKRRATKIFEKYGYWDEQLRKENDELRRKYGFPDGTYEELKDIKYFHGGGIAGESSSRIVNLVNDFFQRRLKDNEIPAILEKEEIIANKRGIFENFIPNLNKMISMVQPMPVNYGNGDVINDLRVYIENFNGTQREYDDLFETLNDGLNKLGKR